MCFMQPDQVPQLTLHAIRGLQYSSCEFVRSSVFAMMVDCDVSGYAISKDPGKHALAALTSFVEMYNVLMEQGNYSPGKRPITKSPAMLSEIEQIKLMLSELKQDRTASSTKGNQVKGGNPQNGGKRPFDNGLGAELNAKISEAIKKKLPTMPPRENIKDDAKYEITIDGKVVAKYCRHCNRFIRTDKQHHTIDHKGSVRFPYTGTGTPTPTPTQTPTPTPTTPAPSPTIISLAAFSPPATSPTPPPPGTDTPFRTCPDVDYEDCHLDHIDQTAPLAHLATTPTPPPYTNPSANLASMDIPYDSDESDDEGLDNAYGHLNL